ncbi:MAG: MBL fold metallo-hydrolase [Verrucomicrobiales bacterium]|nr:MBL fold metallo-hydrolase [Verrucomicrobiales bacterium]
MHPIHRSTGPGRPGTHASGRNTRRTLLGFRCGLSLAFTLSFGLAASAQQDFAGVVVKSQPVAGAVHMLEGAGGNVGVSAGPDGLLIVDNQFAPLAERIEKALSEIDKGTLKFVLNTHWHGDHTGGNAHFGAKAPVVAHANVRKRLADKSGTPASALPVLTYDESMAVHFNGEEIRLIHLGRGHTDGDTVVHFTKSGVAHLGDLFFNQRFPYVDLGSGGDVEGLLKNIEAILALLPAETRLIPGHGSVATRADLETYRTMIVETVTLVKKAIADGKSVDQVKAAGMPERWKDWGSGFINTSRWLEISYNSLKK